MSTKRNRFVKLNILLTACIVGIIGIIIILLMQNWWSLTVLVTLGDNGPQQNAAVIVVDSSTNLPIAAKKTNENGVVNFVLPGRNYLVKASYRSHGLQLSPSEGMNEVFLNGDKTLYIALRGGF